MSESHQKLWVLWLIINGAYHSATFSGEMKSKVDETLCEGAKGTRDLLRLFFPEPESTDTTPGLSVWSDAIDAWWWVEHQPTKQQELTEKLLNHLKSEESGDSWKQ